MSYIEITGKCEEVDENSYTNPSTGEIVTRIRLSLVLPTMRDRISCELPLDKAPKPDLLDRWELDEAWVVVSAESMRALAFERLNARAGEKPVGAMVVFSAVDVREASADERKRLQEERKAQKLLAKQRRAARQAEKAAAKRTAAEPAAETASKKQPA
ncbi:MAG TPA: hypothetical protein VF792_06390 [Ktedonobacterales bacterium]